MASKPRDSLRSLTVAAVVGSLGILAFLMVAFAIG